MRRRYAGSLAVAALAAAAVGAGVPASPARAASCSTAAGVTVVVDFHQLGGGAQAFCDLAGAGKKSADAQLRDAGHSLTPVQRQPGFICRIDGKPADDPCLNTPPADAYWSLWWSDGKSGRWRYSSLSASSLTVPAGGYVGMSWQSGNAEVRPGISPEAHAPTQPSSSPSSHPTSSSHPSTGPGQAPASSPGSTASSSDAATPKPTSSGGHRRRHLDPSKAGQAPGKSSQGPDQTQAAAPTDRVTATGSPGRDGSSGSVPGWVAPVAVAVLFLGAGAIALVRRKTSGGS